ncbi:MAG: hypothetical protein KKB95_13625 [Gammaproteobacteria bacterium]|nr:hypothetical protein [Gammaproteobacteria bacterium]MBU0889562.1 hypothetical protein [Gammaproteobacteria bacterium]MBU1352911.1 hypothetical protein [Gammaproteobacteria bacterium]MBU1507852.1 hypothetical protein [Gammaproteobacteria bacterium]MBU1815180.1 hypothetical protein [Gammaproteobacteria bacterium]
MSRSAISSGETAVQPSAVTPAAPPTTRAPSVAALWEVAGLWLLIVLAGVLLIAFLLLNIRTHEEQNIQRARLALTLSALQESIEGDLALGLDLPDHRAIQPKLERALSGDRQLYAIDVVDRTGVALFSTDRGAIGEPLHPRAAMAADAGTRNDRPWTALIGTEAVTGLPLHNAFGEVVGHISTSYAAPAPALQWTDGKSLRDKLLNPLLLATCVLLVAVVLLGGVAARWALVPQTRRLADERSGTLAKALAQTAAVRLRMDHCLARLDESERQE